MISQELHGIRSFICNGTRSKRGNLRRTLTQYRSYMKVICAEFGSTKVARIAQADIEDWLSESEWAPRTRKNYLVTLMTLFEWARDRGYLVTSIGGT